MDYYVPLSKELAESVQQQLKIDDSVKYEHSVKLFEEWVACETYLPQNYDKILLKVFIRQCKHDMEKAKKKFRNYFIGIAKVPTIYQNRFACLEKSSVISNYMHIAMLPQSTPDGYRICLTKMLNPDPAVIDMQKLMQYMTLIADCRMYSDDLSAGDIYITDAANIHGGHLPIFINNTVKQMLQLALDSFPVRIKALHVISDKPIVIHGINLFKAFFTEKLKQKVHVHKNIESLLEFIPQKCLPADYGGGQKSLAYIVKEMEDCIKGKKDLLEQVERLQIQGPIPKDVDMVTSIDFGAQGSFRKLEVD